MRIEWAADVLRAAGLTAVELPGWKQRGNGDLTRVDAVTWHHDGSGVGASPSIPDYIRRQVDAGKPGANIWVGLDGRWHLIAAGMTFHAGKVLPGKPGSSTSVGVETDHTTGETWSGVVLLDSLRRGTAAILRRLTHDAAALEFHKTVCRPVGRKNDPDGLDLPTERRAVGALLTPPPPPVTVPPITSGPGSMEDAVRLLVRVPVRDHRGYVDLRKGVGGLPASIGTDQVLALTPAGDNPADGWGPKCLAPPELVDADGIARIVVPAHEVKDGAVGVYVTVAG